MSLAISIATPEGIVLAADSRQSYRNAAGFARVGSDTATKVFSFKNEIGIAATGPAFLNDPDNPQASRGIESYINDFTSSYEGDIDAKSVAKGLKKFFTAVYKPDIALKRVQEEIEGQIKKMGATIISSQILPDNQGVSIKFRQPTGEEGFGQGGITPLIFTVAGYEKPQTGSPQPSVYLVYIPGKTEHKRNPEKNTQYGATWTGQTDLVNRVIKGSDPRVFDLEPVAALIKSKGEQSVIPHFDGLEYSINWGAMTVFDAVDLASLLIQTTSAIQRFSDGIVMRPGDVPGVGGPVDIAIIRPEDGLTWHRKKTLAVEQ